MIAAEEWISRIERRGYELVSGVPCSYLTPLINASIDSKTGRYVNAAGEGEAVAIAAGAQLGGLPAIAMFQNSGLGNAVSPLTSLCAIFRIPVLLITTWRGEPGGPADEPQHALMGRLTPDLLSLMEIPHQPFPDTAAHIDPVLDQALETMRTSQRPYALIMRKDSVAPQSLNTLPPALRTDDAALPSCLSLPSERIDPDVALSAIADAAEAGKTVVIATTGFTGRALYALGDRPNYLYMVGSMGCASSFGLGLALARPDLRVIVIDGDGAFLMRMGSLAAIGDQRPPNLTHVVLDNGVHESTGAQSTLSSTVHMPAVAAACGYTAVQSVSSSDELPVALTGQGVGPRLLYLRTSQRKSRRLPRPEITPPEVAARLSAWMRQA